MTDQELRDLVAELAISVKKLEAKFATSASDLATERAKSDAEFRKTERQIRLTNKQLGDFGNRWGEYTEAMAQASLEKILKQRFGLNVLAKNVKTAQGGDSFEVDFLAYSNGGKNEAFVVEIKSKFGEDQFQQVLQTLRAFPRFFPEHAGKKLYGLVAAVSVPEPMRNRLSKEGIYLAVLGDEVFKLATPKTFTPRQFNPSAPA